MSLGGLRRGHTTQGSEDTVVREEERLTDVTKRPRTRTRPSCVKRVFQNVLLTRLSPPSRPALVRTRSLSQSVTTYGRPTSAVRPSTVRRPSWALLLRESDGLKRVERRRDEHGSRSITSNLVRSPKIFDYWFSFPFKECERSVN